MLGDLSEFSLPDILQMFERARKNGQLSIWTPIGIHRIWFYQGRVATAVPPKSKYHLKQILLSSGQLDAAGIAYLNKLSDLQKPLGTALKKQGLVETATLATAFRRQIHVGVHRLLQLQAGQFRFATHAAFPYEEMTGLSKGGVDVAMEGLRKAEKNDLVDEILPQPNSTLIRTSQEFPLLKLSSLEWSIWEKAGPENRISDISNITQTNLLEIRRACQRLVQIGLLEENFADPIKPKIASISQLSPVKEYKCHTIITPDLPMQDISNQSQSSQVNPTLLSRLATMLRSVA